MQAGSVADAELIQASRLGDREAFARIIERYQRAVHAVAFSRSRDRAAADDATQDTFVIAWRRLDELRDASRLAAWLCGIARNLARDARRRHQRETSVDDVDHATTTTPFDQLSDAESEQIVVTALARVPEVYREPLVLYYYQERSIDDVARSLGISAATTNKRLSRGRRYLADCVATVEAGLSRIGPRPGLAASVLVLLGIPGSASHVDASTAVKGSTMNKLSLTALVTASLAAAGAVTVTLSRSDAEAADDVRAAPLQTSQGPARQGTTSLHGRASDAFALLTAPRLKTASGKTTKTTVTGSGAIGDCVAVAAHLQELEADTTHGPTHRPDDETAAGCASHYQARCEADKWSDELRGCVLAAADLINAHLCASGVSSESEKPSELPAALTCTNLGPHLATTLQSAGFHADITDLAPQITAACDTAAWPIKLRQCLGAAASVDALQTCIRPHSH